MATRTHPYDIEVTDHTLGFNLPQRAGRLLWAPMLAMAIMAFPLALALSIWRATLVAQDAQSTTVAALGQFVPAAMFLGFAAVFAAITFAIARILGVLRSGGGSIQDAAGRPVHTLRTPATANLFILLMAVAMMTLLLAVAAHVVIGVSLFSDHVPSATVQTWSEWLEGVRRFGAGTYLLSIALGLATIFTVLGFQATRLRELPNELKID